MNIEEAIIARRSIRKFKSDPIPKEVLDALVESVRLAPSGSNSQPWRLKLIQDSVSKKRIAEAANNQKFIEKAPLIVVYCVDLNGYIEGSLSTVRELSSKGELSEEMTSMMISRMESKKSGPKDLLAASAAFNIGIAGEHLALTAVSLGLGTCWVRALDEEKLHSILNLAEGIVVTAIMPVGYPDEAPLSRRRKPTAEILL